MRTDAPADDADPFEPLEPVVGHSLMGGDDMADERWRGTPSEWGAR